MLKIVLIVLLYIIISTIILLKYKYSIKKNVTNTVIPLNIFQTWHTKVLPIKMQECVDSIKACNPEFNHYLYDDKECRNFIKSNFDTDVLYSYDTLVPGAFKADLWRYCVLYKLGGIYLDIKYKCVHGFKFLTLTDNEYFVKDRYDSMTELAVYNALIICKPGNEILRKCINKVVENVRDRYYGISPLIITGPLMMIEFFNPKQRIELETIYHYDKDGIYYIVYRNKIILQLYSEYRKEQFKYQSVRHYSVLWNERSIYVE
jgi:mannosyltransferase OCH1-like enzyme